MDWSLLQTQVVARLQASQERLQSLLQTERLLRQLRLRRLEQAQPGWFQHQAAAPLIFFVLMVHGRLLRVALEFPMATRVM
jgi:hypothetical protein